CCSATSSGRRRCTTSSSSATGWGCHPAPSGCGRDGVGVARSRVRAYARGRVGGDSGANGVAGMARATGIGGGEAGGPAAGLWVAFRPTLASGFTCLQTDPGDTLLNLYILEHSWQWLTRTDYCGTLWSPPFFHPQPGVLAYSENLLGTAPVYWALRPGCE